MNEIQMFSSSEFGEIRVIEENGKTWFCGADVCRELGYGDQYDKTINRHCKHPGQSKHTVGVQTGVKRDGTPAIQNIQMIFIDESNLYRLITRSRLPKAEEFESWVFDEILPTIRKTGGYGNTNNSIDIEVISKIITATLKELFPLIAENLSYQKTEVCEDKTFNRKRGSRSKVEQLPAHIREDVEQMLNNGAVYREVVEFCRDSGFDISMSAVGRYEKRMLENAKCKETVICKTGTTPHKVTQFPQEIRSAVDFMICNKVALWKIAKYCSENGYNISSMSIWRYRQTYFPYI